MQQWYFLGVEGSVSDKMLLSTLTIDSDDNASCLHPNRAAQSDAGTSDDVIRPWHACTARLRTVVALSVCYVCLLLVISTLAKLHVLVKALCECISLVVVCKLRKAPCE